MKDRYGIWYRQEDQNIAPARPIMAPRVRDLEDLVLQDLAKAETESEKLEILDSYSLACQRKYRNSLYAAVMDISNNLLIKLLGPAIQVNLPEPQYPYHPAMVRKAEPE
jgi:hypothetical protein